jgi:hypothetical protein
MVMSKLDKTFTAKLRKSPDGEHVVSINGSTRASVHVNGNARVDFEM